MKSSLDNLFTVICGGIIGLYSTMFINWVFNIYPSIDYLNKSNLLVYGELVGILFAVIVILHSRYKDRRKDGANLESLNRL